MLGDPIIATAILDHQRRVLPAEREAKSRALEGAGGPDDTGVGHYMGGVGDFLMFEAAPF